MSKKKARRPRSQDLPGVVRAIGKLEMLAETYQEHGDSRKAAKEAIMAEMRRLKKVHYKHGKFEITMTQGESVRVKVDKEPIED